MNPGIRFFIVLFIFLSGTKIALAEQHHVSLQLKWKHAFQFAGFYMAKEKGYYSAAGLEVEIREVNADTDVTQEVLNGTATYGISDSALVLDRMEGKPVTALAAILQHSPVALMTLKSSGITSPKQLSGKKVMLFSNKKTASLTAMLASSQVRQEDFQAIPHSFNIHDLIDGKIDAYEVYVTDQPFQLKSSGIEYNLLSPKQYGFDFYGDILFTSLDEVSRHPERTRAFYKASIEGWKYAFEHIDEAIQLIQLKYNSQQLSPVHLRFEAAALKKLSGLDEGKFGQISLSKIESIANVYRLLGLHSKTFNFNNFIYSEGQIYLTAEEKKFIKQHQIRVITTDSWAPFNILKQKYQLSGIAIDYWNLICEKTSIKSTYKVAKNWVDVIDGIKNKTADITISTSETEQRKQFALFSKPYVSFPIAFATTSDKSFISASDLGNRSVAVGNRFSAHMILKQKYPELNFVPVENTTTALKYVSEGKAFAAADIFPVLAYKIGEQGYANLKISGSTQFNFNVQIMARNDYPELISIINKGIDSISEEERKAIFNKWIAVKYERKTDYSLFIKIISALIVLLAIFTLWNRLLKKEIKRRVDAEQKLRLIATTDVLTSIHNRYKLEALLNQQILMFNRYQRKFSVFFIDLDDFKNINDKHGHETGDLVLIEFSTLIQQHIRKADYFGRWGGEEFLIILPETPLKKAQQLAQKLL